MKKFLVRITETLEKTVEVDAENELDAVNAVTELYRNSEIVLDSSDFIGTDIEVESEID